MHDGEREIGGDGGLASGLSWSARVAGEAVEQLPPVRDDEPTSLRQDILDELRDHFACAFRSELLRTNGDTVRAAQNARERFGDPAKIAQRLWLDAMKGTLMLQKILIGTCLCAVLACVFMGYVLLQALERLEEGHSAAADPEWNPMTLHCLADAPGHPPIIGMDVSLDPSNEANGPGLHLTTEGEDPIDFGLRRPGYYTIRVVAPWKESTSERVTIQPGRASETTIVCPVHPPARASVRWNVEWPDQLASRENVWYVISFQASLSREIDGQPWTFHGGEDEHVIAFHPDGRALDLIASSGGPSLSRNTREAIESLRRKAQVSRPGGVAVYWANVEYRVRLAGLFAWDGDGPPAEMLASPLRTMIYTPMLARSFRSEPLFDRECRVVADDPEPPTFIAEIDEASDSIGLATWQVTIPEKLIGPALERFEQQVEELESRQRAAVLEDR